MAKKNTDTKNTDPKNLLAKPGDPQAMKQPKDDKQAKTEGVVARGHHVKNEGKYKGPGEKVVATRREIENLRSRGFLVDEGRVALPLGVIGPRVLQTDAAAKNVPDPK